MQQKNQRLASQEPQAERGMAATWELSYHTCPSTSLINMMEEERGKGENWKLIIHPGVWKETKESYSVL